VRLGAMMEGLADMNAAGDEHSRDPVPWPSVVVVGTDGSVTADRAVDRAIHVSVASGARLHVVSAYLGDDDTGRGRDAVVAEAAERAHRLGVRDVVVHRLVGPAGPTLAEVAARERADLVVVGNQGMDRHIRLGNVPSWLAHHLPCSLLLVDTG
jgi:nucleotide-binding universal stress UspA family protein